jgi:hypothetical protein
LGVFNAVLRYRDSAASVSVKSKPYGVKGLRLYGMVSATPVTDPTTLPLIGAETKSPFVLSLAGKAAALARLKWTLQHGDLVRVPTLLDRAIISQNELFESKLVAHRAVLEEKLLSAAKQAEERVKRFDQGTLDAKGSLEVGLNAVRDSVAKVEALFGKQIEGQGDLIRATAKNAEDKISDLKDRLTALESRGQGVANLAGWIFGAVGMLVGVAVVVLAIMRH